MTLLCPLPGCRLVRVARDGPGALTILAQARHDHARCPTCRTLSTSVHSRYHRRPADLPVSGKAVRLQLAVRRFYCRDPACPRSTFAERFPRHGRRGPGRSILDPHLDHLQARHAAGCENAMQLWRELRERGFPGTVKQIRRWLGERRSRPARTTIRRLQVPSVGAPTAPTSSPPLPSPKQLSWHLLREPEDLDADAAAAVARVLQDDEAAQVVALGRRFCRIVRRCCGGAQAEPGIIAAFDAWLADARACGVRVVESFAVSLDQDGAAVRAGFRLPWTSGQDEGQVNRLKLLKRSMYGRAKLDQLRRHFLLAA